ncbi:MAG: UDP-2,3-diacylglucosamine diphosphatase, partial [Pseudomonadota bacterium]|nr:UDP-2,3-diacylglucosamine diphosphatase [Pseudomonadota bacterium]
CTALVEHADGRMEIVEWAKLRGWSMLERGLDRSAQAAVPARPVMRPEAIPA